MSALAALSSFTAPPIQQPKQAKPVPAQLSPTHASDVDTETGAALSSGARKLNVVV